MLMSLPVYTAYAYAYVYHGLCLCLCRSVNHVAAVLTSAYKLLMLMFLLMLASSEDLALILLAGSYS